MKRVSLVVVVVAVVAMFGCSSLKSVKDKVSVGDVKKVADLVNMDFGKGPNGPFEVKKTTSTDPKLVIKNDTDRTITVKAKGPVEKTFIVAAGKSDSSPVKSGQYHFTATAPNTNGCEGDVKLQGFNEYTWVFIIKKQ
jgi:hypothetical protein